MKNGVKINGFIDRIDHISNGLHIIDYKSNKYAEKLKAFIDVDNIGSGYWKQGAIYKKLIADNFPEKSLEHYLASKLLIDALFNVGSPDVKLSFKKL